MEGITIFRECRMTCCIFFRICLCVIEYLVGFKLENTYQIRGEVNNF